MSAAASSFAPHPDSPLGSAGACLVVGVGPGNGAALARRFAAAGHPTGLVARSEASTAPVLAELTAAGHRASAWSADAGDVARAAAVVHEAEAALGPVDVLVFNAGSGTWGTVHDIDAATFEAAWRVNALGLLGYAQAVIPGMVARGRGSIVVTGATASLRGGAGFAAFAPAKAAQRSLAQAMARQLGPQGVHVGLLIVDGLVDLPRARAMRPDAGPDQFLQPAHVADAAFMLAHQPRSTWTFELELRPATEAW